MGTFNPGLAMENVDTHQYFAIQSELPLMNWGFDHWKSRRVFHVSDFFTPMQLDPLVCLQTHMSSLTTKTSSDIFKQHFSTCFTIFNIAISAKLFDLCHRCSAGLARDNLSKGGFFPPFQKHESLHRGNSQQKGTLSPSFAGWEDFSKSPPLFLSLIRAAHEVIPLLLLHFA